MNEQLTKTKLIKNRARLSISLLLVAYFDALKSSLTDHREFFERVLRTHEEQKSDPEPDMLDEGERQRAAQRSLERHPIRPQDAARIVCLVHTVSDGSPVIGVIPDFTKLDGDLYRAAWLTLRQFAGIDSDS